MCIAGSRGELSRLLQHRAVGAEVDLPVVEVVGEGEQHPRPLGGVGELGELRAEAAQCPAGLRFVEACREHDAYPGPGVGRVRHRPVLQRVQGHAHLQPGEEVRVREEGRIHELSEQLAEGDGVGVGACWSDEQVTRRPSSGLDPQQVLCDGAIQLRR